MNLKRTIIEKLGGDDVKKLLAALDGRKTVIGLVLLALPDICIQISKLLAMFAPVFAGLEMADWSARMAKWSGAILAAAGGIHKLAKILLPLLKDKTPPVAPLLLRERSKSCAGRGGCRSWWPPSSPPRLQPAVMPP